jgi:hypothetical protein
MYSNLGVHAPRFARGGVEIELMQPFFYSYKIPVFTLGHSSTVTFAHPNPTRFPHARRFFHTWFVKVFALIVGKTGTRDGAGKEWDSSGLWANARGCPKVNTSDFILSYKDVWYGMKNGTKLEGGMVRASSISTLMATPKDDRGDTLPSFSLWHKIQMAPLLLALRESQTTSDYLRQ